METSYDDLHLLPSVVAECVLDETYTANEISSRIRPSQSFIDEIESKRQKMSLADKQEFCRLVDERCRAAYAVKADFFMLCLKGKFGRDQLYVWVRHWLCSYLYNPENLRRVFV